MDVRDWISEELHQRGADTYGATGVEGAGREAGESGRTETLITGPAGSASQIYGAQDVDGGGNFPELRAHSSKWFKGMCSSSAVKRLDLAGAAELSCL